MRNFISSEYYQYNTENSYKVMDDKDNVIVKLKDPGKELIGQYYADKYGCDISFAASFLDSEIENFILTFKNKDGDYRKGMCFGGEFHSTPVIYIKEGKDEGILISDSINAAFIHWRYAEIQELTKIPVYITNLERQADLSSCHTDAMVFFRIATAKNLKTNQYVLPDLLSKLKARAVKNEGGLFEVKLPDEFLITSQKSFFVTQNEEVSLPRRIVHVGKTANGATFFETLPDNRKRYQGKLTKESIAAIKQEKMKSAAKNTEIKVPENISIYLRRKSNKYANLIEIQFYINEIKQELKNIDQENLWTPELRNEFIKKAKAYFVSQRKTHMTASLHAIAEEFLSTMLANFEPEEVRFWM